MTPPRTFDKLWRDRPHVDTDAINPRQFMKSIERTGFGANLFDEWRYLDPGYPGKTERSANPTFVTPDGAAVPFKIDAYPKRCLLEGLDDILITLQKSGLIESYEQRRKLLEPWILT